MSFREEIAEEFERIEHEMEELEHRIAQLPEGGLSCRVDRKSHKWFRVTEKRRLRGEVPSGKSGKCSHIFQYIPKSQMQLASDLALRQYYAARQEDLRRQEAALEKLLQELGESRCAEAVLAREGMAELLAPRLAPEEDAGVQAWLSKEYQQNPNRPDMLRVPTVAGFNVRSKSEAIIANLLVEYKLPFRYECQLIIGSRSYYPDFTILHPDTHAEILWEHFGMMSSLEYQNECMAKLSRYAANGYLPFQNLITTYESDEVPFDSAAARRVIKMMFER